MQLNAKIGLVVAVLDELATIGYITNDTQKGQALGLIRGILNDFHLPNQPTKADTTIHGLQILARVKTVNLNRQITGLATLAEKALSELHNQYAKTN